MSDPPRTERGDGLRRVPIVVALAALLIVGLVAGRAAGSGRVASGSQTRAASVAAPAGAFSSSWFCAGATDEPTGPAPGAVIIANTAGEPVTGVVTLVPNRGQHRRIAFEVGPYRRAAVDEIVPGGSPWIGAIVDVDAGGVAVSQQLNGPLGRAYSPCATTGSTQWYFPTGATLINSAVAISLLNPYSTSAVADLSFTTDQGPEAPQEFEGLVVPAGGLVTVNLGDHLRRRHAIATSVDVRSGRVVAWKTDVVTPPPNGVPLLGTAAGAQPLADPATPIPGVTLTLGAPATATEWVWADGQTGTGLNEQYVVFNPGTAAADLRLAVNLDQGVAEPFELTVPPGQVVQVVSSQEVRIPPGVGHSATLVSVNGVPVVAERTLSATSPSPSSGLAELIGARLAATDWLIPATGADADHGGHVVVYNPGPAVRAIVGGLNGRSRVVLRTLAIAAGGRAAVPLNTFGAVLAVPIVVRASGPVYVESDLYGASGTPGINLSFAVPLAP
jgi:hypothetical protein